MNSVHTTIILGNNYNCVNYTIRDDNASTSFDDQ